MLHEETKELQEAYEHFQDACRWLYDRLKKASAATGKASSKMTQADRIDIAFLSKKAYDQADDLRKEAANARASTARVVCAVYMADVNPKPSIRGNIALGIPDVKIVPSMPSPNSDPENYVKVLNQLGVPADSQAVTAGLVRVHWPTLQNFITERASQGLGPIEGLGTPNTEYILTLREIAPSGKGQKGE